MTRLVTLLLMLPFALHSQMPSWRKVMLENEIDVNQIQIDSLGFLWLADKNSIYRFDGLNVTTKYTLNNEQITALAFCQGHLIIGTSLGRLLKVNLRHNQMQIVRDSVQREAITSILYVDDNQYIIGSYGAGVSLVYEERTIKLDADYGLVSNEVYDIAYFNNNYYIATDQGIQVLNPKNCKNDLHVIGTSEGLSDLVVTNLLVHNDMLWYTDYDSHLGSITLTHQVQNFPLARKAKINDLDLYDQSIYLATDHGVAKFNNGLFTRQYPNEGSERISTTQRDKEGNLWLVNSKGQMLKANPSFQKLALEFSEISALTKMGETFLVGNKEGLFACTNGEQKVVCTNNITHLVNVNDYILAGTFSSGVMVFDSSFKMIDHVQVWHGLDDQSVLHLSYLDGKVYLSSLTGVMEFDFKSGRLTHQRSLNDIIGPGYVYCMWIDDNTIYFGTDRNGLIALELSTQRIQKHVTFHSGAKIGSVYSICQDQEDQIWFTSEYEGLGYIESGTPVALQNVKYITDHYTSLTSTSKGNILAIRATSVDLINADSQNIRYFGKELDIENNTTYLNTVHNDSADIYFVHDNVVYQYTPGSTFKSQPVVVIDEVLVNLTPVCEDPSFLEHGFTFSENENNIQFTFVGSWLTDPRKIKFQYKLHGFDPDWQITKDNVVSYRKLPPGQYRFSVRASKNDQFVDGSVEEFYFEIKRRIYNLWWVRASSLLLLCVIAWRILKAREDRRQDKLALEKLNIENQFINLKNQLNPHFLFNAFNTLIGMIEEDSLRSVAFVEGMTDFYRNMLEYGKHNTISLAVEIEMLEQYIGILKARFNGQLEIHLEIGDRLDKYEIPPMTLQLLVENAVKHNAVSSKQPLIIWIERQENRISVRNKKIALVHHVSGTKTGLANIAKRFELINLPSPHIEDQPHFFEVTVHIRRLGS